MLRTGIVDFVFLLMAAAGATGQEYAWWLTAAFEPREDVVEGIAVRDLSKTWRRASALQPSALPPEAREPGEGLGDHAFDLAVEADMDGDGRRERAVVGVFQTSSGATGRFLLVLGRAKDGEPWRKRALFTMAGAPGFSAVAMRDGRLHWVTCFECDTGCEVVRRWGRFRLRCYSCCEGS
jgi:hypothetical protein